MSIFEPLTLGYDWEVWALKHEMQPGDEKKFERIADRVNVELPPLEGHREWHFIEMGPGVCHNWQELVERTNRYVEWVQAEFAKEDLLFYPCGSIASEPGTAGLHVHVGTAGDAIAEAHIVNAFVRYIPPLLALMVNSPVANWHTGKFKAYRMSGFSWGGGGIYPITAPHLSNSTWYGDVCYRRSEKPTIEIRLADSCMSPRLLCEYALVIAGLTDHIARHLDREPATYTESEYEEFLIDRWQATKDGLQATFTAGGREVGAPDAVREIIEKAAPGMRKLGASVEDLVVIPRMLERRQTQADFQLAYLRQNPDLIAFTHAVANALTQPPIPAPSPELVEGLEQGEEGTGAERGKVSAFERYLDFAPELPHLAPANLDEALLAKIGRDTPLTALASDPFLPPVALEDRLNRLASEGRVTLTRTPDDGIRCTRAKPARKPARARV